MLQLQHNQQPHKQQQNQHMLTQCKSNQSDIFHFLLIISALQFQTIWFALLQLWMVQIENRDWLIKTELLVDKMSNPILGRG